MACKTPNFVEWLRRNKGKCFFTREKNLHRPNFQNFLVKLMEGNNGHQKILRCPFNAFSLFPENKK
jgi:hypothetical protein